MKNMGKKINEMNIAQSIPDKDKIQYPSICLSSKLLPEIEDYKINETIEMTIVCKVTGTHKGYDDNGEIRVDMDIVKAEVENEKEDRKEAKRKGLDMKDYVDLKNKEMKIKKG